MADERSFVMLKPGVLQRRIAGEVINRIERKGYKIIALKIMNIDMALAETHYAEHKGKVFYEKLIQYTVSGPVVAMVVSGEEAVAGLRRLAGPTELKDASSGTIRGDYAYRTRLNIMHASDSVSSAEREIALFFKENELCPWTDNNEQWY